MLELGKDNKVNKQKIPSLNSIMYNDNYRNSKLKEIYIINEQEYGSKKIDELELSTRVMKRLKDVLNVHSIDEMLNLTYGDLIDLKGLGKNSIDNIDARLRSISQKNLFGEREKKKIFSETNNFILKNKLMQISHNEYENLDNIKFNDDEKILINGIKEVTGLIDEDLILDAVKNFEHIYPILDMLNEFNKKERIRQKIKTGYRRISNNKRECNVKWFVYAYIDDEGKRNQMLEKFQKKGIKCIKDFMKADLTEEDDLPEIIRFVNWCGFDIKKDIDVMYEKLYKEDREYQIIIERASGSTLELTGRLLGVTRERIRQIERKVINRFKMLLNSNRIILKIFAERDGDEILTPSELAEYFGTETEQILYLLRRTDTSFYTYDSDLDVFIIGSSGLAERAQLYVDELPIVFSEDKISAIIKQGIDEYNLTEEIICAHIDTEYKKTEKLYHRSRLTLQSIYDVILKKYYPQGIWVYGEKDISEFRMHIKNDYGNIILPENNRALVAQVCRAGILCGRGIYKAKQSNYLSNAMLKKIENYIETSDSSVFMMNTLFNVFEEELRSENVNNKYYLQGILHETFGDKWCFRRDYIFKDDKITSIYTEIVRFIKKAEYPVNKQEIQTKYPGITEIVLNLATNDPKILNLFGCYIHGDNLKITKEDIVYLRGVVEKFLAKKDCWHCKSLYEYIMDNNSIILKKNYINIPFGLFSLLEYCFRDEYNFSRPYIAQNGAEIVTTFEMLQDIVQESDTMEIADISAYARKNYHQISNILGFLDSCNETHLLLNASEIASIDIIGITVEDVSNIEAILDKEVNTTIPINNLKCVHLFPRLNVPWTEWLIYSVIKKWGQRYEVKASEAQLKQSVALIAPKGKLRTETVDNLSDNEKLTIADDLSNIDDLIENFELEELELDEL